VSPTHKISYNVQKCRRWRRKWSWQID